MLPQGAKSRARRILADCDLSTLREYTKFGVHGDGVSVECTSPRHYSDFKYSTKSFFSWSVKCRDLKVS